VASPRPWSDTGAFVEARRFGSIPGIPGIRSDQPGRIVAVFVVSPILLFKGTVYGDPFIQCFSVLLFVWDLYWILHHPPVKA
jgi:hypothetical protein